MGSAMGYSDFSWPLLLENELRLHRASQRFGLRTPDSPPRLQARFEQLPPARRQTLIRNISNLALTLEVCATEGVDAWNDREFFKLSMRSLGVTYPGDFLGHVGDEDVIEAYDFERIQVFRNLRFMETSSYSMAEIQAYEWPELFDRSPKITDRLISYTDQELWDANKTIYIDVPAHLIRERLSEQNLVCRVRFGHIAPLFTGPNKPYGIVASCQAQPIDQAQTVSDNLEFI